MHHTLSFSSWFHFSSSVDKCSRFCPALLSASLSQEPSSPWSLATAFHSFRVSCRRSTAPLESSKMTQKERNTKWLICVARSQAPPGAWPLSSTPSGSPAGGPQLPWNLVKWHRKRERQNDWFVQQGAKLPLEPGHSLPLLQSLLQEIHSSLGI